MMYLDIRRIYNIFPVKTRRPPFSLRSNLMAPIDRRTGLKRQDGEIARVLLP